MDHVLFKKMHLDQQLLAVMNKGILLMECKRYNLIIRLFALKNFYVEVVSNKESHEVITITSYQDVSNLDHLLDEIDISDAL